MVKIGEYTPTNIGLKGKNWKSLFQEEMFGLASMA
jgi:hypothetical protein